jgi:hypothetical protein
MPRRDAALLKKLRLHLARGRRLYTRPGKTGPEKNGFAERPWRGNDTLILRATFRAIEVRYVIREAPESRKVRSTHSYVFNSNVTPQALYDWLISLR